MSGGLQTTDVHIGRHQARQQLVSLAPSSPSDSMLNLADDNDRRVHKQVEGASMKVEASWQDQPILRRVATRAVGGPVVADHQEPLA